MAEQPRIHRKTMSLEGMDCSDCALVIEHRLSRLEGVHAARVDFATANLEVAYDPRRISPRQIEGRVRQLGYSPIYTGWQAWLQANRELLFSLASGIFLLLAWLGGTFFGTPFWLSGVLFATAYLFGGYDITLHALHSLVKERRFDTHLLMVVAALGAASLGEFAEGALLLFLFSLGHALEERVLDRARRAVRALADLSPKTALVRRTGKGGASQVVEVPIDSLAIGEPVIVRPGIRIPVDGEVIAGQSAVDQSPVTGESVGVEKGPGDPVFAGSVNGDGALEVKVGRLAKDSTLARVMALVESAQSQKSPTQQVTERLMRYFVPAVLIFDLGLIAIPPLFGMPFSQSFRMAMTLLVAASPCALALGTPAAVLAGVAQAARSGVLLKGGVHLENLGRLRALAFDKTGTLTAGRPHLTDIISLDGMNEGEILALAAAVESKASHPLAGAILQAAHARQLPLVEAGQVEALTGRGVSARVGERDVWVGHPRWFSEGSLPLNTRSETLVARLEGSGKSVMVVGVDGQAAGLLAVADLPRPEASQALAALSRLGIEHITMLSGDNPQVAAGIAHELGLEHFQAGLLPEEKLQRIQALVDTYGMVGMVGDGVNDAPALAHASLGIAMGSANNDVALETSDVALMGSDLSKLPFAIALGRFTRQIIYQNLVIALGTIVALSGFALLGLAGIGVAVVIHEGSTLLVALNALRLLNFRYIS